VNWQGWEIEKPHWMLVFSPSSFSFSEYQRVAHLAANQWDGIKPDLLQTLRQSQEWGQGKGGYFL